MTDAATAREIQQLVGECYDDPLEYAKTVFPWGRKGTSLEGRQLRSWQSGYLKELGEEIRLRDFEGKGRIGDVPPVQMTTVSGHGIGKSALSAILIKFIHDTRPRSRGTITANTSTQLVTRTWAEVGKWHRLSLTHSWSNYYASRGNMSLINRSMPDEWRVDAFTARKENAEAFQGQHAEGSTSFYLVDEASGVPEEVFAPMLGGIVRGEPMIFLFGNGTRNSGFFYDTHKSSKRASWIRRNIDSRDVEGSNLRLFDEWATEYGDQSDFFKVRVRGMFPAQSSLQFMDGDRVDHCMKLPDQHYDWFTPLIYGVDVARFGDDQSVIYKRRGRDARTIGIQKYRKLNTVDYAIKIAKEAKKDCPDAIFVDGAGVGGGVVDQLRKMNVQNVFEINGANKSTDPQYANMRAQMWGNMKEAIDGATVCLPDDEDLRDDLVGLEYGYRITDNSILLERKEDAKKRGVASPDIADALALTYALPVAQRSSAAPDSYEAHQNQFGGGDRQGRPANLVTDN